MNADAVVVEGVVRADGTLEVAGKVPLPPGKVRVTLEPEARLPDWAEALDWPVGDPFFDMLRSNWLALARAGKPFRTSEEAQESLRRMRDEEEEDEPLGSGEAAG